MSTDIDIRSWHSIIASSIVLAFSALFVLTSCSTMAVKGAVKGAVKETGKLSEEKFSTAKAPVQTIVSQATQSANDTAQSPAIDKAMDNWEKARTAYLRTLDYEQVEQQSNTTDEYLVKTNLIESRYHVKRSETAMYVEHDYQKALQELQVAVQRFAQATKIANTDELQELDDTKPNLDYLLTQAELSVDHGCVNSQSNRYHQVEARIEDLLATL